MAIETLGERPPVQILATDIDTDIIEYGRRAVYPDGDVDSISDERRSRFFLRGKGAHSGQVRVKPAVTALVRYGRVNLISDDWPALGLFDVIFCRNVMIYFDKPTCRSLAERFHRHLNSKGWLFIGHSESLGDSRRLFELQGRMAYRRVD
ncbi:MAG: CheR family methyltransferase [Burkholderiaceae bacterium]